MITVNAGEVCDEYIQLAVYLNFLFLFLPIHWLYYGSEVCLILNLSLKCKNIMHELHLNFRFFFKIRILKSGKLL